MFDPWQPSPAARRIVRRMYVVFAILFAVESVVIVVKFPRRDPITIPEMPTQPVKPDAPPAKPRPTIINAPPIPVHQFGTKYPFV